MARTCRWCRTPCRCSRRRAAHRDRRLQPGRGFERFTDGIGAWWPLRQGFSFGADRCDTIHLEPRVGGRFYERFVDGDELQVGTVTACDPPGRIVFTWAPPIWPGGTEVEVRFAAEGDHRTVVHVEHRGFERLGAEAADTHRGFENGWPGVLACFSQHVDEAAIRDP